MIKLHRTLWLSVGGLALCGCLYAYQRPWRLFESLEQYDDIPMPADAQNPAIKSYAEAAIPVLEKHLAGAKDLEHAKGAKTK